MTMATPHLSEQVLAVGRKCSCGQGVFMWTGSVYVDWKCLCGQEVFMYRNKLCHLRGRKDFKFLVPGSTFLHIMCWVCQLSEFT